MALRYARVAAKFYDVAVIAVQALVERGMLDSIVSGMGAFGQTLGGMLGDSYVPYIILAVLLIWLWKRPKRW